MPRSKPEPVISTRHIGDNVTATIEGDILTLEVDLSEEGSPSASGKSVVLGSTRGNVTLDNGVTLGLNVYRKR